VAAADRHLRRADAAGQRITETRQVKERLAPTVGMVSVVNLVLLGVVLVINTLIAAVMTRFFRIRLKTRAGAVIYALLLIPVVLFVTTMLFGAIIPGNLGVSVLLGVWIAMPLVLGFTIDVLYVPPPEEIELPDTT
jgi:uncharacterized membrane protein